MQQFLNVLKYIEYIGKVFSWLASTLRNAIGTFPVWQKEEHEA